MGTNRADDSKSPRPSDPDATPNVEIEVSGHQPHDGDGPSWRRRLDGVGAIRIGQSYELPTVTRHRVVRASRVLWSAIAIVLLVGLLAALLAPHAIGTACIYGHKEADGDNLKGLMKAYVAGRSEQKVAPTSVGHLFWIAMFTGDATLDPQDAYLTPGDAGFLVCPKDPIGNESEAIGILEAAKAARDPAHANYAGGSTIACYGGPRAGVMRIGSDISGKVVGCTGQRVNVTFFDDGFNVVWGNCKAEYLVFDKLEADPAWGGGWAAVTAGGPITAAADGFSSGPMQSIDPTTFPN